MLVLGVDTSSGPTSLALWRQGEIAVVDDPQARPAETLFSLLQTLLDHAGYPLSAIDRYGVVVGPGSFTGIRAALSAVLGLRLVTEKPIHAFSRFEVYAKAASLDPNLPQERPLAVILENRYIQLFSSSLDPLSPPRPLEYPLPDSTAIIADRPLETESRSLILLPNASIVAALAATHPSSFPPKPLYLLDCWDAQQPPCHSATTPYQTTSDRS